ncbi:response regulator transcription factor [Alkaliphilus peptidifermentans]|uniref:Stage 0 sporulation protein A homolog n=1 Tax=Alkaliphilus peptidifermentans DSM 18978 TaxID=1120976 RepID=A0A1G5EUQ1_9FIRM|nr:response regulator transcription factor [Alkaliphilus peptidifermentans]SCY30664.1 two component transcriptional regulator, LuxR family [Alkaliphilus peptidifermentans DSM 18978]
MKMKLMLVDDHPLFLEGLQYLLGTHGIEVAGIANNGQEALQKARIIRPDIILMDIKMPVFSGLDALKLISAEMPNIRIVMLTTSEENEDLFDAIKYGASGYLLKNTSAKELVDMLSDIEKGEVPLSPGLAARLLKEFKTSHQSYGKPHKHSQDHTNRGSLTERHIEILEMVAKGITYKEVGEKIGLSERTVKYHMERILELLQLENRAQVIAYASRMGLLDK